MNNKEKLEILKNERIGQVNTNNHGTLMKIIKYNNCHDIVVEFQDENKYTTKTYYTNFIKGKVENPFDNTVFGIGYLGTGKWKVCENKIKFKSYIAWQGMLRRCYDEKIQAKRPKYKNCIVAKEWHNYQNFAQWWNENYYSCNDEIMCLDKDILVKNNTTYNKDTCLIVPNRINTLIENCTASRGNLPLGVSFDKNMNLFKSTSREIIDGKSKKVHLGFYDTPEAAFNAYKRYKENYIKNIANEYKDVLPKKVYDALYNYEIFITD